jgi:hypothetical protein
MTNKTINLTPGETLSLNGNQLHGDTVTLTDNNVDDLLTETVNVSGTVALSDMHINTGSLHFVGGTLNFSGTSWLSGNAFRGVAAVFDSNLTGNGTLDLDGGNHDGSNTEINGSVGGGLTLDINPGGYAPTVSLQIDKPSQFHATLALPTAAQPGGFEYIVYGPAREQRRPQQRHVADVQRQPAGRPRPGDRRPGLADGADHGWRHALVRWRLCLSARRPWDHHPAAYRATLHPRLTPLWTGQTLAYPTVQKPEPPQNEPLKEIGGQVQPPPRSARPSRQTQVPHGRTVSEDTIPEYVPAIAKPGT